MDIEVIAEGIETEEQLNILTAQGCDHFQGYYFSKPVSVAEIKQLLKKNALEKGKLRLIQ